MAGESHSSLVVVVGVGVATGRLSLLQLVSSPTHTQVALIGLSGPYKNEEDIKSGGGGTIGRVREEPEWQK